MWCKFTLQMYIHIHMCACMCMCKERETSAEIMNRQNLRIVYISLPYPPLDLTIREMLYLEKLNFHIPNGNLKYLRSDIFIWQCSTILIFHWPKLHVLYLIWTFYRLDHNQRNIFFFYISFQVCDSIWIHESERVVSTKSSVFVISYEWKVSI